LSKDGHKLIFSKSTLGPIGSIIYIYILTR